MIFRRELNSSEKVILCTGDTSAKYKLLEYDAIFDEQYATSIGEMYTGALILYTKVTSIHYEFLKKQVTVWKIDVNNLSVRPLQGLLLLLLDKRNDFGNKNKEFYNPSIKNIGITINGIPHQLCVGALQARDLYPELKKYFYNENSDVTWKELLTTKICIMDRHTLEY